MDPQTPNHRSIVPRPHSPSHETMAEKKELHELNSRLEVYINHVRDLTSQNRELRKRVEEVRGDPSMAQAAKKRLEDQLALLRKDKEEVSKRVAVLERKLTKSEAESLRLQADRDRVERELTEALASLEVLSAKVRELEELRAREGQQHHEDLLQLEAKAREHEAELEKHRHHSNEVVLQRLDQEKEAWKKSSDEEHAKLAKKHEGEVRALKEEIAKLETENTNLRIDSATHAKVLADRDEKLRALKDQLAHADEQLQRVKDQRDMEATRGSQAVRVKDEEVAGLRAQLAEAEREFALLKKAKMDVDAEIRAYRRLLSGEESRLGLASPPRITYPGAEEATPSRKRSPQDFFTPARKRPALGLQTAREPSAASTLASASSSASATFPQIPPFKIINSKTGIANIDDLNPTEQYIRISNMTSQDINLDGWFLQVGSNHGIGTRAVHPKRYKFTNTVLPAEHSVNVKVKITGDNEPAESDGDLMFSSSMIQPGAFIQLFDANDLLISQVELASVLDTAEDSAFERVCSVM